MFLKLIVASDRDRGRRKFLDGWISWMGGLLYLEISWIEGFHG